MPTNQDPTTPDQIPQSSNLAGPPRFLWTFIVGTGAMFTVTILVLSNFWWHSRRVRGASLVGVEVLYEVLAALVLLMFYWIARRSPSWRSRSSESQGVSPAALRNFAVMLILTGIASIGAAIWLFVVPWGSNWNAGIVSALAAIQIVLACKSFIDCQPRAGH